MKLPHPQKPLRVAAICILLGLAVMGATLFANHPLAFVAFLLPGAVLVVAGALLYLTSLALGWRGGSSG